MLESSGGKPEGEPEFDTPKAHRLFPY